MSTIFDRKSSEYPQPTHVAHNLFVDMPHKENMQIYQNPFEDIRITCSLPIFLFAIDDNPKIIRPPNVIQFRTSRKRMSVTVKNSSYFARSLTGYSKFRHGDNTLLSFCCFFFMS